MPHITGQDRSQTLLLPESLDDYVAPENPVRFIEAFVDGLDLAAGFARVLPKDTGRLLTCRPICSSSTYMVI
jgi:transposase